MKLAASQFDELALAELDVLYRVARRLTGNSASAEDLVQETYTRAFGARGDFDL
jgi:RNA polymerase sigma-70 factor (ECF subfamily)